MSLARKFKEELADIKSGIDGIPDAVDARRDKWLNALPYWGGIDIDWVSVYRIGGFITAAIAFIACWIYAVISWGLLLGIGLGWIPSLFIGAIAGFIWPLLALVLVLGIGVVAYLLYKT